MRSIIFLLFIFLTCNVHAQESVGTMKVIIGNEDHVFTRKVYVEDVRSEKRLLLKDGKYKMNFENEVADITIQNNLITGVVERKETFKKKERDAGINLVTRYKIEKSLVRDYTIYGDSVLLLKAYRDVSTAYYKSYYPSKILEAEGWMSLDKNKHYGMGITRNYFKDGTPSSIKNDVAGTYTDFYSNGNKKSITGRTISERYNEDGSFYNKQYTKNNVGYDEYYKSNKLYTRAYKNQAGEKVIEYFKNGIFDIREIYKEIKGEKKVFIYNKAGKLIDENPYDSEGVKEVNVMSTRGVSAEPAKVIKEKSIITNVPESSTPATFPGGTEAYQKYILDHYDTDFLEENLVVTVEFKINADGTVVLENKGQSIFVNMYASTEMNRVLKYGPKWEAATHNGIPKASTVKISFTFIY